MAGLSGFDSPIYNVSGVAAPASRRRSTKGAVIEQAFKRKLNAKINPKFPLDNCKNSTKLFYDITYK